MISKKMLLLKKMNYNLITYLKNDNDKSISGLISGNIQEFEDENIINIKQYLFIACHKLTRVNLPKCITVGRAAFFSCRALENLNLPKCIELGYQAFGWCESLKSIELPECRTISSRAFEYCTALTSVILRSPTVCGLEDSNIFSSNTPIATGTGYIYVPDALVHDYKKATNWSVYANQIKPLSEYTQ